MSLSDFRTFTVLYLLGESGHGEVCHGAPLEEHVHHLGVADVVVALVHALSVPTPRSTPRGNKLELLYTKF